MGWPEGYFERNPLPTDWMARREGVAAFDA